MFCVLIIAAALAQPGSPLAGPAVAPMPGQRSLVRYDFNSRLRRPETSPERAAVELLGLSPSVRTRADDVFARRAALIDAFVAQNLFLLQELDTAGKAGNKLDQVAVILRTLQKIRPVLEPGPMRDQVSRVLPGPDAARFRAIVDEYWAAVIKEGLRDARARGKKDARWQVDLGERFKHLGEEIARSYERQVASGTLFVDYFMSELHLSPEQTRIINDLKLDMLRQSGMRPGEKDQQRLVLGALAYLTADQRAKVIKRLTGK